MLNLSSGNSGSGNYIRFMPSANAWLNNVKAEIQLKKVVFDFDNVQTGWMLLAEGTRDWQPDASLGAKGPQPTPDHKRGFSVKFYNKELGTVEWSANGTGPNMGLEALYKAVSAQRADNAGKLPVIEYTGSKLEKIGKGTTRIPNFNVVSWVVKPEGMDAAPAQDDGEQQFTSSGSVAQAAPAPKSAMAQAVEEDEMF
jgi:hypothetical protein